MNTKNLSEDIRVKMSEAATPAMAVGNRVSTTRIVGVVALAYAASMIVQNVVFAVTGAPDYSDPLGVVLTYHAENQGHLLEDISVLFAVDQASDFKNDSYEYKKTTNKGHGASKFVNVTAPPTRPTYA